MDANQIIASALNLLRERKRAARSKYQQQA